MLEMSLLEYIGGLLGAAVIGAATALVVLEKLGKIRYVPTGNGEV